MLNIPEPTLRQRPPQSNMAEEPRGVSDSSAALQASNINGGGCLPPPTPSEKIGNSLSSHMMAATKGLYIDKQPNYRDELPKSLAWRTTTQNMMVGGLAGEVTPEELAKVPENLMQAPPVREARPSQQPAALRPGPRGPYGHAQL